MKKSEIKAKLERIYNDAIALDRENKGVDIIEDQIVGILVLKNIKELIDNIDNDKDEYETVKKCIASLRVANDKLNNLEVHGIRIPISIVEDTIIELTELSEVYSILKQHSDEA